MTGFGRAKDVRNGWSAEIRSVNGRFLKLNCRLPSGCGAWEERIKKLLSDAGVRRGNVDVALDGFETTESSLEINEPELTRVFAQWRKVGRKLGLTADADAAAAAAILSFPGVVRRKMVTAGDERHWRSAEPVLAKALAQFKGMRRREGAALAADIDARLQKLAEHREVLVRLAPEAARLLCRRLRERLAKIAEGTVAGEGESAGKSSLRSDALEREVAIFADRVDFSEELTRLASHLKQMRDAFGQGGEEIGKTLDFLTQELLREVNTVGSKAQDAEVTRRVVAMKGLIEKIREQVQNLE